jgi:hypothetical protein
MSSWIDLVLNSTEEAESPRRFYYWSAICTLSAIVSPNIYLDRFYYKLSPNLYVFLVGESGIRKGPPITLAASLVKQMDCTRVIKGRSTIQGIIKVMGTASTLKDGTVLADSRAFLAIGEFGSGLIKDPQGVTVLMDLYDTFYNEDWDNTLATVPVNKLVKPCITFFAASNEANLEGALPVEAIEGGFIARTLIVEEKKRRTINSLAFRPASMLNTKDLCQYLFELKKVKGEMIYDNGAATYYHEWYNSFVENAPKDKTGTINRITDTILKVAMLIQLSKEPALVLKTESIEEAIEECLKTISGMKRVTMGYGKGELSAATKSILTTLIKKFPEGVKRSTLLSNHWGEFDSVDLDRIIENLDQSQAITISITGDDKKKEYEYKLKLDVYIKYTEYLEKKEG